MVKFENREELQPWLKEQPRAVSVVIATRGALRVLPLLAVEFSEGKLRPGAVASDIVLPVFRAMAVSWAAGKYPERAGVAAAAIHAAAAANLAARAAVAANAVCTAAAGAVRAVYAADANANTAFTIAVAYAATAAAAYAADHGADASWAEVHSDAKYLQGEEAFRPDELASSELWDCGTPDGAKRHWGEFKQILLKLDPKWQVWSDWYEARLAGRPTHRHATPEQNQSIDIARATIDDEIWRQGPAVVNAEIERLEKEILGEEGEADDDAGGEPVPQWAEVLSELGPAEYGFSFRVEAGRFAIDYSGDESDAAVADDPITQQLHEQLKRKSKVWAEQAIRLDNQIGWSGIGSTSRRLSEALDGDTSEVARRIGEVWGEFVELGSYLELDGEVRAGTDSIVTQLDPELRRPLTDLITTGAPWVRRFPSARELDDETPIFLSGREDLDTAKSIIVSAGDSQLLIKGDAELIKGLFDAAERGTHQSKKAGTRAIQTSRSFLNRSASYAAAFYMASLASAYGPGSPSIQAISQFMIQAEKNIIALTADAPADISIALRELMKKLHEDAGRNEAPLPQPSQIVEGEGKRRRKPKKDT